MNSKRVVFLGWLAMLTTLGVLVSSMLVESGRVVWLRYIGVGLLMSSALLFIPPFYVLARFGRAPQGRAIIETSEMVMMGPYAIVRHPQYVGYMLLNAGFTMLTQTWLAGGLSVFAVGVLVALGFEEERLLTAQFGEVYTAYCQRVPRFNVALGLLRYGLERLR